MQVTPCPDVYDLRKPRDLVPALGATVQVYRLLRQLRPLAPMGQDLGYMRLNLERTMNSNS